MGEISKYRFNSFRGGSLNTHVRTQRNRTPQRGVRQQDAEGHAVAGLSVRSFRGGTVSRPKRRLAWKRVQRQLLDNRMV